MRPICLFASPEVISELGIYDTYLQQFLQFDITVQFVFIHEVTSGYPFFLVF